MALTVINELFQSVYWPVMRKCTVSASVLDLGQFVRCWYWNLESDNCYKLSELVKLVATVNSNDEAMCHGRDLHSRCHAPTAEKEWEVAATRTTGGRGTGAGSQHTAISQHLLVPRESKTNQVRWSGRQWRLNDGADLQSSYKTADVPARLRVTRPHALWNSEYLSVIRKLLSLKIAILAGSFNTIPENETCEHIWKELSCSFLSLTVEHYLSSSNYMDCISSVTGSNGCNLSTSLKGSDLPELFSKLGLGKYTDVFQQQEVLTWKKKKITWRCSLLSNRGLKYCPLP